MSVLVAAATDWSGVIAAVLSVAAALVIYYVAAKCVQWILYTLRGQGLIDPWEGYTAEDDKRDRKAAGL